MDRVHLTLTWMESAQSSSGASVGQDSPLQVVPSRAAVRLGTRGPVVSVGGGGPGRGSSLRPTVARPSKRDVGVLRTGLYLLWLERPASVGPPAARAPQAERREPQESGPGLVSSRERQLVLRMVREVRLRCECPQRKRSGSPSGRLHTWHPEERRPAPAQSSPVTKPQQLQKPAWRGIWSASCPCVDRCTDGPYCLRVSGRLRGAICVVDALAKATATAMLWGSRPALGGSAQLFSSLNPPVQTGTPPRETGAAVYGGHR